MMMISKLLILSLMMYLVFSLGLRPGKTSKLNDGSIKSMAYVSKVLTWYGEGVINNIGVNSCYDILILTFWISETGPADVVQFYDNIYSYVGSDVYGKNNDEVQQTIANIFQAQSKLLFISAFGATDFPTKQDPLKVADKLATWVNAHPHIDGVDLDYEDNGAIQDGSGVTWLISFTKAIRSKLTNKNIILTHAPQAPYFSRDFYSNGAYYTIDQQVGHLIDWYNVQFYNQNDNKYDTFQTLFVESGKWFYQTSYQEIIENTNIPISKLVLGKPAIPQDADNTGYVDPFKLGQIVRQGKDQLNLTIPAFFIWQLVHDQDCSFYNNFYKGFSQPQHTHST